MAFNSPEGMPSRADREQSKKQDGRSLRKRKMGRKLNQQQRQRKRKTKRKIHRTRKMGRKLNQQQRQRKRKKKINKRDKQQHHLRPLQFSLHPLLHSHRHQYQPQQHKKMRKRVRKLHLHRHRQLPNRKLRIVLFPSLSLS